MQVAAALAVLAATFNIYPGKHGPDARIEASIDRGPILELIVRCRVGTAIVTYSKLERRFCGPDGRCDRSRDVIIHRACS